MGEIERTHIEDEMRESYINYAMSVIRGRAIPDVRDGLKPVQRRILYGMQQLGITSDKPQKKCARIVGEVMGKYHPHGDQAIYDTLVNMAQDFSFRYPLIDGQGNFGSLDGDAPAAMRYTEARLSSIAERFLDEIGEETVDFAPNFDDSLTEPVVLPAKLPNLLLNGSWGISVGMTTQIPPHNLGEVIDGVIHLIDHPQAGYEELQTLIPGPDFPTGGLILGREGIDGAYQQGEGRIRIRAKVQVEDNRIIVSEIPYQVRKSTIVETIARKVKSGEIAEISDLRDESDRNGLRIVIEFRRNANPQLVLNKLYRYTPLEWTFGANFLVITNGNPRKLSLKEMLGCFVAHRREVVRRRTAHRLRIAEERVHLLEGLLLALAHREEIIKLITGAKDAPSAQALLQQRYELSEIQADAILKMRLRQFTGLERDKIGKEHREKQVASEGYRRILASEQELDELIKQELRDLKDQYADPRRSQIIADAGGLQVTDESLIPDEDLLVGVSSRGYVNAPREDVYRRQHRGGKGVIAMRLRDEDRIKHIFLANARDHLLVFSTAHKAYKCRAYDLPSLHRAAKGENLRSLIGMSAAEQVAALVPLRLAGERQRYCLMATRLGILNTNKLDDYASSHTNGIIAINAIPDDRIVDVAVSEGQGDLILASAGGQTIRFAETQARCTGRPSKGVRGLRLNSGDELVALTPIVAGAPEDKLLLITENGYGKRTPLAEFPKQGRGGKGVLGIKVSRKTGRVVTVRAVCDDDEILIITELGKIIRIAAKDVRVVGRYALGVKVIGIERGDRVVSIVRQPADKVKRDEE
ncbi:MAG TPA: DNA gyrase subunit A [Candidatus Fraserbacteria bacterium]|nr:DNA gyrase subunit A [Candidatus Fraserbacteria bacterium]